MQKAVYMCVATLAFAAVILGQVPPACHPTQDDKIVVGTNLVTVNVTVTDSNGRYVKGLSTDQFTVYDNNVKQQIAHFSADAEPFSIGIVCEIHESAPEQTRTVLAAVKQFTGTLGSEDDFFFVAFGEHGSVSTDFVPSPNQLQDHLQLVKPGGPSSLYDVVYHAANRLKQTKNLKKALILISDGRDTTSRLSYKKLRDRLRTLDAQIYAIGIADPELDPFAKYRRWYFEDITRPLGPRPVQVNPESASGRAILAELSRASGGTVYLPETENEPALAYICSHIALELRQQYTLAFYPNPAGDDGWHKLKVRVRESQEHSNLSLSYRKGYQVSRDR